MYYQLCHCCLQLFGSGFVAKIMHRKKRAMGNDEEKLFLNIVHSEQVAKPNASNSNNGGSTWSIPYSLGPLRMERDKSGTNLVATFDCCFHPLSLRHAHARKEFLDLAINIATDAVENYFAKFGDKVKITKGYTILRGVTYKSGTPKAMLVSHGEENEGVKRDVPNQEVPRVAPKIAAETLTPLVPKYQIVEQGVFDMADHAKNPLTQSQVPQRPKFIIVRVYLDKSTTTATNINLDVSEKELKIHPDVKCRYDLTVKLPYPVNPQEGNARFDTKQSTLIVKLPVLSCIK